MIKKFMNKNVTYGGLFKLYGICWLISFISSLAYIAYVFGWFTKIKNKFFKKTTEEKTELRDEKLDEWLAELEEEDEEEDNKEFDVIKYLKELGVEVEES